MIKNILQPSSVDSQTEMVLVNAIYFKGLWEKAFKDEDTQAVPFRITEVHGQHNTLKVLSSRICEENRQLVIQSSWIIALNDFSSSLVLTILSQFYTLKNNLCENLSYLVLQQESKPVQMMYQIGSFKVAVIASEKIKILELPYASGQLSMLVLLPDDVSGLEQVWPWQLGFRKPQPWWNVDAAKPFIMKVILNHFTSTGLNTGITRLLHRSVQLS